MKTELKDDILTVFLEGEIDHHCAKEIRKEIDRGIYECLPKGLVLDFEKVSFMDSSGIGLVIGRFNLMNENGGKIAIANPSNQIKKVMKLSGIDKFSKIITTKNEENKGNEGVKNESN